MGSQKVKGAVLKSRLAFVEKQFGPEGLDRVMESLDPEDRKALRGAVPVAWLDFEIGKRLDDSIVKVLGQTGRREYEQTGEREGVLTTYEAETFSKADCLTVIGWYKRALELCGAKNPRIVEDSCRARGDEVCRYRVSWQ
jgi:hypothetical protein